MNIAEIRHRLPTYIDDYSDWVTKPTFTGILSEENSKVYFKAVERTRYTYKFLSFFNYTKLLTYKTWYTHDNIRTIYELHGFKGDS